MKDCFGNLLYRVGLNRRNIKLDFNDPKNINSELCKECGGMCCQRCGCHFSPRDFNEINYEYLKSEIKKGYITIDLIDGELILRRGFFYILRVRNEGRPIVDLGYERNCCVLWSEETGCKLDFEKRPAGGKLLIPKRAYDSFIQKQRYLCYSKYSIADCCYEWERHKKILSKLAKFFRDKDYPCSI